jgi:hypothetical protein
MKPKKPEFRYKTSHFYKEFFMVGDERRIILAKWYKKMLESPNMEIYCNDLVDTIFDEFFGR